MKGTVQQLSTQRHRVYQLAPGLLVIFKPRGHREVVHTHLHRQSLRVLRGALRVSFGAGARLRTCTLRPGGRPLSIAAGRSHGHLRCATPGSLPSPASREDASCHPDLIDPCRRPVSEGREPDPRGDC